MADVLFFHGLESGPQGHKARWLRAHYDAATPQLPTLESLEATLAAARAALATEAPRVVVGSSYGGAVAVALAREGLVTVPMVLIAPAAQKVGVVNALPAGARAVIFHARRDPIVPYEDSIALADGSRAHASVSLVTLESDDHALNALLDDGSLAEALAAFGVRRHA